MRGLAPAGGVDVSQMMKEKRRRMGENSICTTIATTTAT